MRKKLGKKNICVENKKTIIAKSPLAVVVKRLTVIDAFVVRFHADLNFNNERKKN